MHTPATSVISSGGRPRPSGRHTHGSQTGYTLLETGIVVSLLSVLLTLAVATWNGAVRERRVVHAADEIVGVLRLAQQLAVADSADACRYRLITSSAQRRTEVYAIARDTATDACTSPPVLTLARRTDTFPNGVSVADTTVEFSSEGRLAGTTPVSILISAGDRVRYVQVEPGTGRVTVASSP